MSISELDEWLEEYKNNLATKTQTLVDRLLEVGIQVANMNTGEYAGCIIFSRHVDLGEDTCVGVLVAEDKQKILRTWKYRDSVKGYEVSPLLLAEFGSGFLSEVLDDVAGVGQGTMPQQIHAFDEEGWHWVDEAGKYHHSIGEKPTHPMHSAMVQIMSDINRIAKEVFNG